MANHEHLFMNLNLDGVDQSQALKTGKKVLQAPRDKLITLLYLTLLLG